MLRLAWLLLAIFGAASQAADSATIFLSDSKDPKPNGGRELLEAVCPGRITEGQELGCTGRCPPYTSLAPDELSWSLVDVSLGHFVSRSSDDAVLSMQGCEPHTSNFGGSILLTRNSTAWKMLWYKAGVITSRCHKVARPDGREILVCMGESGAQGNYSTDIYTEDLLKPAPTMMASSGEANGTFLSVPNNTNGCPGYADPADENRPYTLMQGTIRRVDFLKAQGRVTPSILVLVTFGERRVNAAEAQACGSVKPAPPPVKTYRIRFDFSGTGYTAARGSAAVLRMLSGR